MYDYHPNKQHCSVSMAGESVIMQTSVFRSTHHLDVVPGTRLSDPVTARLSICLGRNALENVLDVWPRRRVAPGHDRRSITGALLTARHT